MSDNLMMSPMSYESDTTILTYLRIRPNPYAGTNIYADILNPQTLCFDIPDFIPDFVSHTRLHHEFQFDAILPMNSTQEEVFEAIGKPCVQSFIEG